MSRPCRSVENESGLTELLTADSFKAAAQYVQRNRNRYLLKISYKIAVNRHHVRKTQEGAVIKKTTHTSLLVETCMPDKHAIWLSSSGTCFLTVPPVSSFWKLQDFCQKSGPTWLNWFVCLPSYSSYLKWQFILQVGSATTASTQEEEKDGAQAQNDCRQALSLQTPKRLKSTALLGFLVKIWVCYMALSGLTWQLFRLYGVWRNQECNEYCSPERIF